MSYSKAILFDFVSSSLTYGQIVSIIIDQAPVNSRNVYYEIIGPVAPVRSPDFNTPDAVLNVGTPSATMPLVSVPLDSNGMWLEGTYTINFYIENVNLLGTYDIESVTFVLDVKKQGLTNCNIQPNVDIAVDCHCLRLRVEDITNYQGSTLISRLITITPPTIPNQPAPVNIDTANPVIEIGFSYTGVTYMVSLVSIYENLYAKGQVTVREDIIGTIAQKINCQRNVCKLIQCLEEKILEMSKRAAKLGSFYDLPISVRDEWELIQEYFFLYNAFADCGDWVKADKYFDKLQGLLNCDCGCTNSEMDVPVAISPSCGNSSSITTITSASPQLIAATTGTATVLSLDPNFIAAALAISGINNTTPTLITTSIALNILQIALNTANLDLRYAFGPWITFTNANSNNVFGAMDFDNTPYPLSRRYNTSELKELIMDGTFKYDAYNPGIAICLLNPASLITVLAGTRTGIPIPCFNDSGKIVGSLQLLATGTTANVTFTHNSDYIQNSNVKVNGRFNLS